MTIRAIVGECWPKLLAMTLLLPNFIFTNIPMWNVSVNRTLHIWEKESKKQLEWQLILNWTCFNFTISSYCYCYLPSTVSFPPTYIPSFLPPFPSQLDIFTSQILISKTSAEALALPSSRQLCSSQPLSISSASLRLLFSLMRSCSYHFSLGLRVIQAQTEGSQTSVHTWDQDSQGHVSTHCPWDYVCVGVSACVQVRDTVTRPDH